MTFFELEEKQRCAHTLSRLHDLGVRFFEAQSD